MTRACETCEWWQTETFNGRVVERIGGNRRVCTEGPEHLPTLAKHFCGRWRIAERLTDEARP